MIHPGFVFDWISQQKFFLDYFGLKFIIKISLALFRIKFHHKNFFYFILNWNSPQKIFLTTSNLHLSNGHHISIIKNFFLLFNVYEYEIIIKKNNVSHTWITQPLVSVITNRQTSVFCLSINCFFLFLNSKYCQLFIANDVFKKIQILQIFTNSLLFF